MKDYYYKVKSHYIKGAYMILELKNLITDEIIYYAVSKQNRDFLIPNLVLIMNNNILEYKYPYIENLTKVIEKEREKYEYPQFYQSKNIIITKNGYCNFFKDGYIYNWFTKHNVKDVMLYQSIHNNNTYKSHDLYFEEKLKKIESKLKRLNDDKKYTIENIKRMRKLGLFVNSKK